MRGWQLSLLLACGAILAAQTPNNSRISGPYTHQNLTIFLVHGPTGAKSGGKQYLTLKDAMEQKKVTVFETKQVNELAVENVSDEPVFIQGGDIVEGGQQDRVISNDFVLPPRSGRVPLSAFCVEQGRWTQRGSESATQFGSSTEMAASKPLKFSAVAEWNQLSVWNSVKQVQRELASLLPGGKDVVAAKAPTSFAMSVASPPVESAVRPYVDALSGVAKGKNDAVGMMFAVNGEVSGGDVYASPALFAAMWPKLLKASAVEAVRLSKKTPAPPADAASAKKFMSEAEGGRETTKDVDRRVKLVKRESERVALVESRENGVLVHRSYIGK